MDGYSAIMYCIRNRTWLLTLLIFSGCNPPVFRQERNVVGTWKIDSMFNYVNGFTEMNNIADEHWSMFQYSADGVLAERKFGLKKDYRYQFVAADSLIYTDSSGALLSGFKVLRLDGKQLVLKKMHKPFLSGKNQELYEIRFFSKVPPDSLLDNSVTLRKPTR